MKMDDDIFVSLSKQEESLAQIRATLCIGVGGGDSILSSSSSAVGGGGSYLSFLKSKTSVMARIDQFSHDIDTAWAEEYRQSNSSSVPSSTSDTTVGTAVHATTAATKNSSVGVDEGDEPTDEVMLATHVISSGGLAGSPNPLLVDNFVDIDDADDESYMFNYVPSGVNLPQPESMRETMRDPGMLHQLADVFEQSCSALPSKEMKTEEEIETIIQDDDDDDYIGDDEVATDSDDLFSTNVHTMPNRAREVFLALGAAHDSDAIREALQEAAACTSDISVLDQEECFTVRDFNSS